MLMRKIFEVISLGLAIIIISLLMPDLFRVFEELLIQLFETLGTVLAFSQTSFVEGDFLPASTIGSQIIPR